MLVGPDFARIFLNAFGEFMKIHLISVLTMLMMLVGCQVVESTSSYSKSKSDASSSLAAANQECSEQFISDYNILMELCPEGIEESEACEENIDVFLVKYSGVKCLAKIGDEEVILSTSAIGTVLRQEIISEVPSVSSDDSNSNNSLNNTEPFDLDDLCSDDLLEEMHYLFVTEPNQLSSIYEEYGFESIEYYTELSSLKEDYDNFINQNPNLNCYTSPSSIVDIDMLINMRDNIQRCLELIEDVLDKI